MASAIGNIDRELRAMWKSAAAAREESGPIYRAALCNLVTILDPESHRKLGPMLVEVTRRHPSRLILVEIDHGEHPRELSSEVAALCRLRPAGGYVCSEQIVLRGGAAAGPLVPSAVRSLQVGNLPLMLLDLRTGPTASWVEEISERADLRVVDSASLPSPDRRHLWTRIAEDEEARLRDLSWSSLAPWREVVADAIDNARIAEEIRNVSQITIEVGKDAPCGPAASLLGGWIASRLGWSAPRGANGETRFRRPGGGKGVIHIERFGVPGRDIRRVRLMTDKGTSLREAMATRGSRTFEGEVMATRKMGAPFATVEIRFRSLYDAPFIERDLVSLILTEMQRHRPNRVLSAAARFAAEISLPDEESSR